MSSETQDSESSAAGLGARLRRWVPPVSAKSLAEHYVPLSGAACHSLVAVHLLSPDLLPSLAPRHDLVLANLAVLNSSVALGYWLHRRSHLRKASPNTRLLYSAYLASSFNFGSILLWALTKYALPRNLVVRSVFGVLTSLCLLSIGREYMAFVDYLATEANP